MKRAIAIITAAILTPLWGNGSPEQVTLTIYNAASTTDLVEELAEIFTEETGIAVRSNPGSSGVLAKQILQGAPADIYLSASSKWVDYVDQEGLSKQSAPFVTNALVLVAPQDSKITPFFIDETLSLKDLFRGRLSLGDPNHVPAGAYAAEALSYYGWDSLLANRLQPAGDVRAALAVVEMGEVELGIVYRSDALKSERVKEVALFPSKSHSPIEYYCALIEGSCPEAELFYSFLLSDPRAKGLYVKYGFGIVGD